MNGWTSYVALLLHTAWLWVDELLLSLDIYQGWLLRTYEIQTASRYLRDTLEVTVSSKRTIQRYDVTRMEAASFPYVVALYACLSFAFSLRLASHNQTLLTFSLYTDPLLSTSCPALQSSLYTL